MLEYVISGLGAAFVRFQPPLRTGHRNPRNGLSRLLATSVFLILFSALSRPQLPPPTVNIQVDADQADGPLPPIWSYFGYDEPNYSYASNGRKLLGELAALSPVPVYIRTHNLLTSGDGSSSLKWGSTGVYTEDAAGKPVYNWVILDRIFDTFRAAGVKPLVEIGFMPEALSTHPQPYRHSFPAGPVDGLFTGWAYPPKDYQKWSELVFQLTHHLRERYGDEVKSWLWEVWNEPDIPYWKGTPDEFFKLYDFSVDAILRALPEARIGGPDSTGPASPRAEEFLRLFLDHCAHQKNYVSGKVGSRLDFISFHPKGSPTWQGDHVQMGISHQLAAVEQGFKIVSSFPEWRRTPIILGESDPEGCAACSARTHPQNAYRNGPLFASYTVEAMNGILALAGKEQINIQGAVTWSFEFEGQPYFEGFRELANNGLDKPVLNTFRMFGLLGNEKIKVSSSGAIPPEKIVLAGVRGQPDVNAWATRKGREVEILIWNYHDDDSPAPDAQIDAILRGLPKEARSGLIEHFRVDSSHSNAFALWQKMGSPQSPSHSQLEQLQDAGQLQLFGSPAWIVVEQGSVHLQFALPRQALSLVRVSW
jgi:xylan 1,4-beta-xylosidase